MVPGFGCEDACLGARPRRFYWRSLLYMLLICWSWQY